MAERGSLVLLPKGCVTADWTIKDFFDLKDSKILSPPFSFLDAKWILTVYPKGEYYHDGYGPHYSRGGWALTLRKESQASLKQQIYFKLGIKRADGSVLYSRDVIKESLNGSCDIISLNKKSSDRLESKSVLAPDNFFRIFCIIRLSGHSAESASQTSTFESIHLETLCENLTDLCHGSCHSDIVIRVQNKEFQAHRSMLSARSKVFASMFAHDTAENLNRVVDIEDFDPGTFKNLLHFMYTGEVNADACSDACELYKIADKYDLQELKADCVERMTKKISVDSFCDVTLIAVVYNESELLETATKFFIKNMKNIFPSMKWQSFLKNHRTIANELLIKMANAD